MSILKFLFFFLSCSVGLKSYSFPTKKILGERNVSLKLVYKVSVTGHVNKMRLKMVLPATIKNRQTLNTIEYSIQPDSVYTKYDNTYAIFKFYDVEDDFKITIKENITIYQSISGTNENIDTAFSQYLIPEKNIESENEEIKKVAVTLKEKTDIETIMKTFSYVKDNIAYKKKEAIGALEVLETGVGKCMDFSDLFVALLRANNIPAKSIFGLVLDSYGDVGYHAWPEAYLKKQGWVQFDPTTGHSDIRREGKNYVMSIKNKYIMLLQGRNEPELRLRQYSYNWWGATGNSIKVKQSYTLLF